MPRLALAALLLALAIAGCGIAGSAKIEAPVTRLRQPAADRSARDRRPRRRGRRAAGAGAGAGQGRLDRGPGDLSRRRQGEGLGSRSPSEPTPARPSRTHPPPPTSASSTRSRPAPRCRSRTTPAWCRSRPAPGGVDLTQPAAGYPNSPDRYRPSGSPNFARTVPADDVVVDAAANWASELGATQAAVTSDGSAFQNLAASEFKSAATEHGIQVMPGKPPSEVAVAANTGNQAVYEPGPQRLSLYGRAPGTYSRQRRARSEAAPGQELRHRSSRGVITAAPASTPPTATRPWASSCRRSRGAGTDASSFRDNVRNGVFGAQRDGTVLGSYSITSDGDTTECMIQRYRLRGTRRVPLGAPCPPH